MGAGKGRALVDALVVVVVVVMACAAQWGERRRRRRRANEGASVDGRIA